MNRSVGALRWLIRQIFRDSVVPVAGEAGVALWMRPAEYPSLLTGVRRVEADISREWAALLRPDEVIFDVGANIGFTVQRFYALLAGRCRIWAFEPLPRNIELLERNVRKLEGKATVVAAALGNRTGTVVLKDNVHHGGLSRLQGLETIRPEDSAFWREVQEVEVPMTTIDAFVNASSDVCPSFIKLDVEGAGHWVLAGAGDVLKRFQPVVSCSFHSDEERDGITQTLLEHGYRGVSIDASGTCRWCSVHDSPGHFVHPGDKRARSLVATE